MPTSQLVLYTCLLALICATTAAQFTCTYTTADGIYYDFSALQHSEDLHIASFNAKSDYYFGICRESTTCLDSPVCAVSQQTHHRTSYGRTNPHEWSEIYTAKDGGVSLVYENGEMCPGSHYPRTTTLIMECDRNVEFRMVDFDDKCHSFATIRSKHACPVGRQHTESNESDGHGGGWIAGVVLGSLASIVVVLAIVVLVLVAVGLFVRRRRSEEGADTNGVYSEMISGGDFSFPEAPAPLPMTYSTYDASGSLLVTPGLAEV